MSGNEYGTLSSQLNAQVPMRVSRADQFSSISRGFGTEFFNIVADSGCTQAMYFVCFSTGAKSSKFLCELFFSRMDKARYR